MRGVIQTSRRRHLILIGSDLGQDTHEDSAEPCQDQG
jgi:hypothetical protein